MLTLSSAPSVRLPFAGVKSSPGWAVGMRAGGEPRHHRYRCILCCSIFLPCGALKARAWLSPSVWPQFERDGRDLKLSPILAIPRTQVSAPLQRWDFLILAVFCPSEGSFVDHPKPQQQSPSFLLDRGSAKGMCAHTRCSAGVSFPSQGWDAVGSLALLWALSHREQIPVAVAVRLGMAAAWMGVGFGRVVGEDRISRPSVGKGEAAGANACSACVSPTSLVLW